MLQPVLGSMIDDWFNFFPLPKFEKQLQLKCIIRANLDIDT